ncbi:ThuA domain-containing protein [Microbacterium ulmi]|uniref:ThuA domain-containing protein n=1 Tax=Microbacterium ulmi TaxID=179095 RepID=A0A7Y2M120_9MICO|nr:ThuA domain-containing protein [Microbacterium ulmi]
MLILSGSGRYADPWHPFAATSAIVAGLLADRGLAVEVSEDVEERLADLDDVDLLIVNAGDPVRHDPAPSDAIPAARAGLVRFAGRGGGILGLHAASASLRHIPEWSELLGGAWITGRSMHPEIGETVIAVTDVPHPVTAGLTEIATFDERYSHLDRRADVDVLAVHTHDGIEQPVVWAKGHESRARTVYSALGHDERAYVSPAVQRLVVQAAAWALRDPS